MFLVGISLAFTSPYVDLGNLNRIWTDFGEADEPTSCFWFRMTASNFSCTWKDRILALTCGEAGHCKRYTYYIILYYIILYYSILYYSILYYIILYYINIYIYIYTYTIILFGPPSSGAFVKSWRLVWRKSGANPWKYHHCAVYGDESGKLT